jgi:hypothetical protein
MDSCYEGTCVYSTPVECTNGQVCSDGRCTGNCTPQCSSKNCGSDGCDGSCGICNSDNPICNSNNQCVQCLIDSNCPTGFSCDASQNCYCPFLSRLLNNCEDKCAGKNCVSDDACIIGNCNQSDGACVYDTITCPAGKICSNGICVKGCSSDCTGKTCGSDCGVSCGSCGADNPICSNNKCVQCLTDSNCGAEETCDVATGTCVCPLWKYVLGLCENIPASCTDSDNGPDYYVKGIVSQYANSNLIRNYSDVCFNPIFCEITAVNDTGVFSETVSQCDNIQDKNTKNVGDCYICGHHEVSDCVGDNCFVDEVDCNGLKEVDSEYKCTEGCSDGACVSNNVCKKEGEAIPVIPNPPVCCAGLSLIAPKRIIVSGKDLSPIGIAGICTAKCGDGICNSSLEDSYNCPQDCNTSQINCSKDSDCGNQNVCSPPKCVGGLCEYGVGMIPPPCDNATWKDYPDCSWDDSGCNNNCIAKGGSCVFGNCYSGQQDFGQLDCSYANTCCKNTESICNNNGVCDTQETYDNCPGDCLNWYNASFPIDICQINPEVYGDGAVCVKADKPAVEDTNPISCSEFCGKYGFDVYSDRIIVNYFDIMPNKPLLELVGSDNSQCINKTGLLSDCGRPDYQDHCCSCMERYSYECLNDSDCASMYGDGYYCDSGFCYSTESYCGDGVCDIDETTDNCSEDCKISTPTECIQEGKTGYIDLSKKPENLSYNCCQGLYPISTSTLTSEGLCASVVGGGYKCTTTECGNNICETGENKCNCLNDCKTTCTPNCIGKTCGGEDGCGGKCLQGSCPQVDCIGNNCPVYTCSDGTCIKKPDDMQDCTDTDGGQNANVYGTVKISGDNVNYADYCLSGSNKVNEWYCEGSSAKYAVINCPNGCKFGACIQESNNTNVCRPDCAAKTCGNDGCGGVCGGCGIGQICSNGTCANKGCIPLTCAGLGKTCGSLDNNGCNGILKCGSCSVGDTCQNGKCTNSLNCTDSDSGINYYVKGEVKNNVDQGGLDCCTNSIDPMAACVTQGNYISEKFCTANNPGIGYNSGGGIGYIISKCTNGCKDGACIK